MMDPINKMNKINKTLGIKVSGREPLPAKVKNIVRDRANNKCEFLGCRQKENLHFHHKNQKNDDNKPSNIELLCPNHHAKRHNDKIRKVVSRNILTGEKKTKLVKKTTLKKKAVKKTTTKKKVVKKKAVKKKTGLFSTMGNMRNPFG